MLTRPTKKSYIPTVLYALLLLYCTILSIIIIIVVVNDWINMSQTQQHSGPRYKVNVTNAVSVRKSWKTDTSSTMYGNVGLYRLALTWCRLVGRSNTSLGGDDRTRTVHSFPHDFRLQFWVGLRTPNLGEGEAVGNGSWYRSKERWWVLYRPSIITFPLSLRISEILPLLFSSTPLFPTPPLVSPNFPMFPGE